MSAPVSRPATRPGYMAPSCNGLNIGAAGFNGPMFAIRLPEVGVDSGSAPRFADVRGGRPRLPSHTWPQLATKGTDVTQWQEHGVTITATVTSRAAAAWSPCAHPTRWPSRSSSAPNHAEAASTPLNAYPPSERNLPRIIHPHQDHQAHPIIPASQPASPSVRRSHARRDRRPSHSSDATSGCWRDDVHIPRH
jgi:hypothetical protein